MASACRSHSTIVPNFFRLDLELIWSRDWLFVGHDCEAANPGSFFTFQIGDYPVVVVCDLEGRLRAFHNTCRHRGSRVCVADKGDAACLVCPYHHWSYSLDGRLLFARQMADGFDKAKFSLKAIACESVAGYILISLAGAPPDFAPLRSMIEPYFAPHRLSEVKLAHEHTIIEKGNWKLVWENNGECYHCSVSPACRSVCELHRAPACRRPKAANSQRRLKWRTAPDRARTNLRKSRISRRWTRISDHGPALASRRHRIDCSFDLNQTFADRENVSASGASGYCREL